MTTTARITGRQAGILLLTMFVGLFLSVAALAGPAYAQDDDECYPVPPGGCDPAPTCEEIIAAIETGDVELDQNGDGEINAADLPADCTCAELLDAIAAGTLDIADLPDGALDSCGCQELLDAIAAGMIDVADLPAGLLEGACDCDELQAAADDGTIDESLVPEGCDEEEEPVAEEEETPEVIAEGGFPTSTMGAMAALVLAAGAALVLTNRREV